ncbi:hypothetical protein B0O80DRAFT_13602 [Mortierella sp. GBAus27b]|nr:hypothetical protein B0O80DRAFT_13602 [Mortierella sp. GBAus27b]
MACAVSARDFRGSQDMSRGERRCSIVSLMQRLVHGPALWIVPFYCNEPTYDTSAFGPCQSGKENWKGRSPWSRREDLPSVKIRGYYKEVGSALHTPVHAMCLALQRKAEMMNTCRPYWHASQTNCTLVLRASIEAGKRSSSYPPLSLQQRLRSSRSTCQVHEPSGKSTVVNLSSNYVSNSSCYALLLNPTPPEEKTSRISYASFVGCADSTMAAGVAVMMLGSDKVCGRTVPRASPPRRQSSCCVC